MKRTWVFVVSYLVVMALTYVWPWVSNMGLIVIFPFTLSFYL